MSDVPFLERKLPINIQKEILRELFGFSLVNNSETASHHWVIYDGYEEFYGNDDNLKYDLSNLKGIFEYHEVVHKQKGADSIKSQFRKLLDL